MLDTPYTLTIHDYPMTPTDKQDHPRVLRQWIAWQDLYFYQKADALYQITYYFCKRFLRTYGDRTVDQMVQAARSGKQNIIEGIEDGQTSSETEIRLLNVARGSLQELREDYEDYLKTRHLSRWQASEERYKEMTAYSRRHNLYSDYAPYLDKWSAEEICNVCISLCHQTDRMMCSYLSRLEKKFAEEGGIKERMYAVRTGRRQHQQETLAALTAENARLRAEVDRLRDRNARLRESLSDISVDTLSDIETRRESRR